MTWTNSERDAIRLYYPAGGVAAVLPHMESTHTHKAIQSLAHRLGVKCLTPWRMNVRSPWRGSGRRDGNG